MLGDSFFIFGPAHEAPRMLQLVMKFKIYIPPILRMLHTKMVTICREEEVKKMLKNDGHRAMDNKSPDLSYDALYQNW